MRRMATCRSAQPALSILHVQGQTFAIFVADYIGIVDDAQDPSRTGCKDDSTAAGPVRLTAFIHGQVQGVGFRWWTRARALELGLTGSATNMTDGRVQVVAEGTKSACEQLLAMLRGGRTPGSVAVVVEHYAAARGERGFAER